MLRIFVVAVLVSVAYGQTNVDSCTSAPLPLNVNIGGCVNTPCVFYQLDYAEINIIFKAPYTIRSIKAEAKAFIIWTIGISHDLEEHAVACNFLNNTYCPILKDEIVDYTLKMYVEPTYPAGTSLPIEFTLLDENSVPFLCIRVPIRIAPPLEGISGSNSTVILEQ